MNAWQQFALATDYLAYECSQSVFRDNYDCFLHRSFILSQSVKNQSDSFTVSDILHSTGQTSLASFPAFFSFVIPGFARASFPPDKRTMAFI